MREARACSFGLGLLQMSKIARHRQTQTVTESWTNIEVHTAPAELGQRLMDSPRQHYRRGMPMLCFPYLLSCKA